MKRTFLVGLVVASLLVVGTYWYFSSSSGKSQDARGSGGASEPEHARGEESRKAMESRATGQVRGGGVQQPSSATAPERGGATALGVAGVKPRPGAGGGATGDDASAGGTVEVEAAAPPGDKLAALKPQRGTAEQVTVAGQLSAEGEVPPEVVFEGGKEKRFETATQVQLEGAAKIAGDAGTMAFWLKPDWEPSDQNDAVFVQIGEGQQAIRVAKNVNFLRFEFFDSEGRERGVGVPLDDWKPGDWHQVSATWVQGRLQLYVDGKPVSQNTFEVVPVLGEDPKAYVGSKLPSGSPAVGEMVDVRILNRPLQPNEVEELARKENRPE